MKAEAENLCTADGGSEYPVPKSSRRGETADYLFGENYYRFFVNGPGDYRFTGKIPIVGNEKLIRKIGKR